MFGLKLFSYSFILIITTSANGELYTFFQDIITSLVDLTGIQPFLSPLYPDKELEILLHEQWDFIIIGSSPSGIVLANRLTENENINVLLLEAGEEASVLTDIPIIAGAFGSSNYDYGYKTEPQPHFCIGCTDNRVKWERGKALGGGTIINYMLYVRGNKRDFNLWSEMGGSGWAYDDLLPYFKKIEDTRVNKIDEDFRGKGGYLTISDEPWRTKISEIFVNAAEESGLKYVDYNGKQQIGVSFVQTTTKNGLRDSAEKAYLRPVRHRPNLVVQTNAQVTRILFKEKTAYGVRYFHDGIFNKVTAKKEVILSAGTINSAQLLMLSGIGPKEDLQQLGIPVLQNLPVGRKIYDHSTFPLIAYQLNESVTVDTIDFLNPLNLLDLAKGKGRYTSTGGVEVLAFVKTNISTDPDPLYPDVELLVLGGSVANDDGIIFRNIFNIPPNIYDVIFKPLEGKFVYQVTPILLHPVSHGFLKLKSSDPFDAPLLYANYFSDPNNSDIKTFIAGIREIQRINEFPSLRKVGATLVTTPVPGCELYVFDSDEYWECALRIVIGSYFHMVSSCKMGRSDDKEAIVDYELKVFGIDKLRVVDVGVIPLPLSGHTMSPGYVIGEKAADIIKRSWNI
ncbi:glucose dehydrogenase [FAD, quinone]-like [Diorhabda sublineata]|uniref:glucose dehydrogenase [FAD, quinone]-like n=1 Tax=Diorhabda sublineata TaxID=1163346 RepID=UPI0024E04F2D|nr:glucose dehydrogenase [FAD, quinone]-like [Diorhabda sublineata]